MLRQVAFSVAATIVLMGRFAAFIAVAFLGVGMGNMSVALIGVLSMDNIGVAAFGLAVIGVDGLGANQVVTAGFYATCVGAYCLILVGVVCS